MSKTLYLPDSVHTRGIALPRAAREAYLQDNAEIELETMRVMGTLEQFNKELREIDPYLKLVKAKETTTVQGLKPGYYHLVRYEPGFPAYIKPVQHDNGEYREPDSSVFEMAMLDDMWNDRTRKALREARKKADEARKRQKERESMDRAREFDERLASRNRVQIHVRSKPW